MTIEVNEMRQAILPGYDHTLKVDDFNTTASTTRKGKDCIIVIHGIMGSELYLQRESEKCSRIWPPTDLLAYPNNPQDKLAMMMLDAQGQSIQRIDTAGTEDEEKCKSKKKDYYGANDSYGTLMRYLKQYFDEKNVLFYNYDWRKSVSETGKIFATYLETVVQNYERIYIVAHSMGGLVSVAAMQMLTSAQRHIRLITLGTPFWGAPYMMAYMYSNNLLIPSTDYNLLDMKVSIFKNVVRNMPSSYDLLPSSDYLAQVPYLTLVHNENRETMINKLLDQGETEAFVYKQLNSVLYQKKQVYEQSVDMVDFVKEQDVLAIIGYDFATPNGVVLRRNVRAGEAAGRIIEDEECVVEKRDYGDGTVPLVSATLNYQIPEGKYLYVKERHGGLVRNKDILNYIVHKIQDWDVTTTSFVGYNKSVLTKTMQTVLRKEMSWVTIKMKMNDEMVGLYDRDGVLIDSIHAFSNYYITNDVYREDDTSSQWTRLFFGLENENGAEKYFIILYADKAIELVIDEEPETIALGTHKIFDRICIMNRPLNKEEDEEKVVDKQTIFR